jgi:hypothetical protein
MVRVRASQHAPQCASIKRTTHTTFREIYVTRISCRDATRVLRKTRPHHCPSGWHCTHHQVTAFSWQWQARSPHNRIIKWSDLRR